MDSEPTYTLETAECTDCQKPFEKKVYSVLGRLTGMRACPACAILRTEQAAREAIESKRAEFEGKWNDGCPVIYRDTDTNDPRLNQQALNAALMWNERGSKGLGLIGSTGVGKTRCLYLALRRAYEAKLTIAAISHTKFSRIAMDAFSGDREEKEESRKVLRKLYSADVVLLDDLGKPPSTERADSELEELVEDRTSEAMPILWTANGSGEWLIKRFGVDRGEPTVRRLAEFCDVHSVK